MPFRTGAARLRAMMVEVLSDPALQLKSLQSLPSTTEGQVTVRAALHAAAREDTILENAVRVLSADDDVRAARWTTGDDDAALWIRPG